MTKWNNPREATYWIERVFMQAAHLLAGEVYSFDRHGNYRQVYAGRDWFRREYLAARLHNAVYAMMEMYRPDNWQQLLLEWPHKSASDPNRLAYTRDERAGEADRQTVTTIGKYLTRHFSSAPDYVIRDIVAQHTYGGKIEITTDLNHMINAVMQGPASCMTKRFDIHCADGKTRHPYAVYDPQLGWSMAVRYEDGEVMGRCLIWSDPEDDSNRGFVRSYKREKGYSSHSGRDEAIDAHLTNLGYCRWSYWPDGTPLMEHKLYGSDGWLMPYIDGGTQLVDSSDFTIHGDGDIEAANTDGRADYGNCTCEDCGNRFNDDSEGIWTGIYEDHHVCGNCDEDYTYAYSRWGNRYYIRSRDVIEVDGEYYDTDYLSDNSIVELANGDYSHTDNAVWVESEDAYYDCDDDDICYAEDSNQYEHINNCWQCEETCKWWTDDEESIEVDGKLYHPDHAPEPETNDEDESSEAA